MASQACLSCRIEFNNLVCPRCGEGAFDIVSLTTTTPERAALIKKLRQPKGMTTEEIRWAIERAVKGLKKR